VSNTISKSTARRIAVSCQGLHSVKPFGSGKSGVLGAISHLGYVQIDTISVTERANNHVIWSRVPDFRKDHLLVLQQKDRKIFEYWAHAAAYLPMQDYRFCIPTMEHFRSGKDTWRKSDKKVKQYVVDRIRSEGPLKSRDFAAPERTSATSLWDWKPTKIALQRLFFTGELMISHREGFQRVYDLTDRILPAHINTSTPTQQEFAQYLIRNAIRANGLIRAQEASYLRKGMGAEVRNALSQMCENGELAQVAIRGVKGMFYTTSDVLNEPIRISKRIKLLSPFDNAVIQRERVRDLFEFDYQIEMYVPKPKRKHGYYCLPILYGDKFIGRVDVKADRKSGTLQIIHLILEDGVAVDGLIEELARTFRDFAAFNGCAKVVVQQVTPGVSKNALARMLK
jgi:uncharacterized protein YcaQ